MKKHVNIIGSFTYKMNDHKIGKVSANNVIYTYSVFAQVNNEPVEFINTETVVKSSYSDLLDYITDVVNKYYNRSFDSYMINVESLN